CDEPAVIPAEATDPAAPAPVLEPRAVVRDRPEPFLVGADQQRAVVFRRESGDAGRRELGREDRRDVAEIAPPIEAALRADVERVAAAGERADQAVRRARERRVAAALPVRDRSVAEGDGEAVAIGRDRRRVRVREPVTGVVAPAVDRDLSVEELDVMPGPGG